MDGIWEGSPLVSAIQLWDRVEALLQEYPHALFTLCIIVTYFTFFGTLKNGSLTLAFFYWLKLSHLHLIPVPTPLLGKEAAWILLGTVIVAWVSLSCLQWGFGDATESQSDVSGPYLVPSRTKHTRLFPKRHSFSYSYLLAGIPVGFKGNSNGMVSADMPKSSSRISRLRSHKALYDVDSADYLARGFSSKGLRGKLDDYLHTQGVSPSDYPYAFLVTAARFLGYHFNPVSFWYLYTEDKVLSAIVLEVNNTFGERRPYFVPRDFAAEAKRLPDSEPPSLEVEAARPKIKNSWAKDFHVSPFNSRKGSYSLLAADPLGPNLKGFRGVDVTINLSSSKGHPKLIARLFSEGDAIDPYSMGILQKVRFLCSWFWVGFITFPRIVKEAALLFFKRELHVWYRPEPLKKSLGRHADRTELVIESAFREYLRSLVKGSPTPLSVKYIPSGITERGEEVFTSPNAVQRSLERYEMTIQALTPSFYSRFVGYAHDVEAIFCEMAESCTLWVDKPDVLPKVFLKKPSPPLHANGIFDFITFKIIQTLRRRPEAIKRPMTSADHHPPAATAVDIRDFRISSMDGFVLGQNNSQLKTAYGHALIRHFLADRLFSGCAQILDMLVFLWHLGTSWMMASMLSRAITKAEWAG